MSKPYTCPHCEGWGEENINSIMLEALKRIRSCYPFELSEEDKKEEYLIPNIAQAATGAQYAQFY